MPAAFKPAPLPKALASRPEILAPAGTRDMMRAAVENGADAVYFGVQEFNARLRAANFALDELPETLAWLHERGVRGYLTLNTLVFPSELEEAARVLLAVNAAGIDAVLVQDLGVARLANALAPEMPVHASTQMSLTSAESVAGVEALGLRLSRVVLARELSRKELGTVRRGTEAELEVFVHGAICVAYSGQCLTSEALGGRSANRGECAQACRLPYDLMVDGKHLDVGDLRYVLSPKDLSGFEDIGDLVRLGIVSLKIEGRLKSPAYVAATVRAYRDAVDRAFAADEIADPALDEANRRALEMTFSRGFTGGYLHEINHQAVVEGRFPKKRGLFLGTVTAVAQRRVAVRLQGPLKCGDGVVFDAGRPDGDEQGGRVYTMFRDGQLMKIFDPLLDAEPFVEALLEFGSGAVDLAKVNVGDRVWKTSDPALDAELDATWAGDRIRFRRPVEMVVRGAAGAPLALEITDEDGLRAEVLDAEPAATAAKHALDEATLCEQLGRLGNTPFELRGLEAELEGALYVPVSRLNELRRRAVAALVDLRRERGTRRSADPGALARLRAEVPHAEPDAEPRLSVLCRTLAQVRAAVESGAVHTVYTDFEDIRLHREARALVPAVGPRFVPATLRVMKPGESGFVRKLIEAAPDAVLVRNLAAWQVLRAEAPGLELLGDYSLNVANELTAALLRGRAFTQLVPSYDLNIEQLLDLLRAAPPAWFEVTLHQYIPMFHMEHCVFCRYLSDGTDFTNCGRPCESHELALRDRVGYEHYVKADAGCRNTVFNAVAQSASAYLPQLLAAGVSRWRIDFLREDAEAVRRAVALYAPAVRGEVDGREIWRHLRANSKLGVTRGSLDRE
ncbi:MAG: DUF3656 domain-containing protein [Candidatus Sumerlaeia bacterium]|nr:DUF3656 domain-containing protein [Candidatus Sumerlaeia bacterium]